MIKIGFFTFLKFYPWYQLGTLSSFTLSSCTFPRWNDRLTIEQINSAANTDEKCSYSGSDDASEFDTLYLIFASLQYHRCSSSWLRTNSRNSWISVQMWIVKSALRWICTVKKESIYYIFWITEWRFVCQNFHVMCQLCQETLIMFFKETDCTS